MLNRGIVLNVYHICPSRCHGLLKKRHLQFRHTFTVSLSMQLNRNSKNGSEVMHFLSTQRSIDGSTSSEPIKLCKTSIVKILTDNHILTVQVTTQRCGSRRLCCPQTAAQASLFSDEVRSLESTGGLSVDFLSQLLLEWLQQGFSDRLISCRCDPESSPHSPDIISHILICGDTL